MSFSAGRNLQNNINTTEAQTLSNKTLDNTNTVDGSDINNSTITGASIESPSRLDMKQDTLANLQTYAASATNGQLVYATDAKKTFQVVDAALVEVGGGSAAINYIENSDAEQNVDGWNRYVDAVQSIPEDGTGGLILDITFTQNTTSPLRGTADFNLNKTATDAQGQGVAYDFTIDKADQAKKLTISFDYDASDVNYADDDIGVFIYDVTNSNLIRVNGENLKGGKGKHYAQFQTAADSTSYRLILHIASTNATEYDVYFDNFSVGPRELAKGTIVSDWKPYTPTNTQGFGTLSNVNLEYKRVGDSLKVRGEFNVGTNAASEAQIELPDSLKVKASGNTSVAGVYTRSATTNANGGFILITDGDSYVNFSDANIFDGAGTPEGLTPANGNAVITSSERMSVQFSVPIQGWSSNAVTSEDLGGREVHLEAYSLTDQVATSNFKFEEIVRDTSNSYNPTSGVYIIPSTGIYNINCYVELDNVNTDFRIDLDIDGVTYARDFQRSGVNGQTAKISLSIYLEKGQEISFQTNQAVRADTIFRSKLTIAKLASPQTILETETVAARYTSNSGQSISTDTVIIYENLEFDTHNAYNTSTGEYTTPVSGYYQINSKWLSQTQTSFTRASLEVNGTRVEEDQLNYEGSNTAFRSGSVSAILYLNKGDILECVGSVDNSDSLSTTDYRNTFSIARIK